MSRFALILSFLCAACAEAPQAAAVLQSETAYAKANDPGHLDKPYVLLISLDGFRHDYADLYGAPNLSRLGSEGVRAESLIPAYPAETFPNHYSIATGMYPANHGIVANDFFDRSRGARYRLGNARSVEDGSWYGGTPLWVAAERQGMVTASYFWVGTEADIQGVHPSYYHLYDASVSEGERIDAVLDWLSYPDAYRPHLITLYFSAVDSAGHRSGTSSPTLRSAIRDLDQWLGMLFEGIEALDIDVNVFVMSDHGMIDLDPQKIVYLDELVDLDGVRIHGSGAHSFLYVDDPIRRAEVLADLKAQEDSYRVYRREETPASWHLSNDRAGDLIVEADPPYSIRFRRTTSALSAGGHGYDPQYPEMRGIFYARGPDLVRARTIPSFENVHIYPLVMRILGLEVTDDIDGRMDVLEGIRR